MGGRALIEEMMTPFVLTAGEATDYGLCLIIVPQRGVRRVLHGGADTAHRSHLAWYPDVGIGIIVQSNHAGFQPSVVAGVTELFVGEHMEPLPAEAEAESAADDASEFDTDTWDRTAFDDFVGRYYSAEFETFYTVALEGGGLVLRHRRLAPGPLTHESGDTFRGTFPMGQIAFERNADGVIIGFRASNGRARDILFERMA